MASFEVNFDSEIFEKAIRACSDEQLEEALNEAAPILEESIKKSARKVIEHEGDSEMVESIRADKPKRDKNGAYRLHVGPHGNSTQQTYYSRKLKGNRRSKRRYKVSNTLKAIWKEYGIPGHQPARPFFDAGTKEAESAVEKKMTDVIEKGIES